MSLIIKITMSKQTNISENGSSLQQNRQNDNVGEEERTEGNGNVNNGPSNSSSREVCRDVSEMELNTNVAEEDLNVNKNEIQKSSSCSKLSLIKKSRSCKSATRSNTTQNCTADGVANAANVKKKGHKWALKFNCAKLKPKSTPKSARGVNGNDMCVCTGYRKVESDNSLASANAENNNATPSCIETGADVLPSSDLSYDAATNHSRLDQLLNESDPSSTLQRVSVGDARDNMMAPVAGNMEIPRDARRSNMTLEERQRLFARNDGLSLPVVLFSFPPLIDLSKFNPEDYPTEDIEARARLQRALEIEEGVDAPPGFRPNVSATSSTTGTPTADPLLSPMAWWLDNHQTANCAASTQDILSTGTVPRHWQVLCSPDLNVDSLRAIFNQHFAMQEGSPRVHTQVDYIHCLVPDLKQITACSFYWGKMDRYEAETLLEGKPEGTFLLRDSAQEEYLFSVSFRKYGRSLHARIEQFNHRFSFDSHDPGVFSSNSVTGLLEHYKDPSCVMFFEPMLTVPLNRNFTFSLQQLCRSVIVTNTTYDGIASLNLPRSLRSYLREYHYRQRVRVKRFEDGNRSKNSSALGPHSGQMVGSAERQTHPGPPRLARQLWYIRHIGSTTAQTCRVTTLAIDYPGHGLSSRFPKGFIYNNSVDYLLVIIRVVRYFSWDKVSLLGHSMSGFNTFMYTAIYPETVDFAISIDALPLWVLPLEKYRENLRYQMNKFLEIDDRNDEPPAYRYDELVEKLHNDTHSSIAKSSSHHLLHRAIKKSSKDPAKYYFTRDNRLKVIKTINISREQYLGLWNKISCPYLAIKFNPGMFREDSETLEAVENMKIINPRFEYRRMDGGHHTHLSTPPPAELIGLINAFINKHCPPIVISKL